MHVTTHRAVSDEGTENAIAAQSSAEVLLASGGADGPCWSGDAGAGCDDVGGDLPPNGGA